MAAAAAAAAAANSSSSSSSSSSGCLQVGFLLRGSSKGFRAWGLGIDDAHCKGSFKGAIGVSTMGVRVFAQGPFIIRTGSFKGCYLIGAFVSRRGHWGLLE